MEVLDSLLSSVRRCCEGFPDKRRGTNGRYTMADVGLAALSVFFTQSPSFLDHQRQLETGHGRSNCQTLFGIDRIPSDNHIRAVLDPVAPDHLFPGFGEAVAALERSGGMQRYGLGPRRPVRSGHVPRASDDELTIQELAEHLGAHRQTVYGWLRRGQLSGRLVRVGTQRIWLVSRAQASTRTRHGESS